MIRYIADENGKWQRIVDVPGLSPMEVAAALCLGGRLTDAQKIRKMLRRKRYMRRMARQMPQRYYDVHTPARIRAWAEPPLGRDEPRILMADITLTGEEEGCP